MSEPTQPKHPFVDPDDPETMAQDAAGLLAVAASAVMAQQDGGGVPDRDVYYHGLILILHTTRDIVRALGKEAVGNVTRLEG